MFSYHGNINCQGETGPEGDPENFNPFFSINGYDIEKSVDIER